MRNSHLVRNHPRLTGLRFAPHGAAMKRYLRIVPGVGALLLFASCASLISGTRKSIRVTSDPPGALVRIDGTTRAVTPAVIHPSVREDHFVTIELAGFPPQRFELKRRHSGWLAANVTNGVVPGVLLDVATGAAWSFDVAHLHASFRD
jgi:hypothetical protein